MSKNTYYNWLHMQLGASLEMLEIAVQTAVQDMWNNENDRFPFWKEAFHVIYYVDYYFSTFNGEEKYDPNMYQFPKFLNSYNVDRFPDFNPKPIPKDDMLKYLSYARSRIKRIFDDGLIEKQANQPSGWFEWLPMTKGELIIYNIRHIMEHVAILNQILKKYGLNASEWQMAFPV